MKKTFFGTMSILMLLLTLGCSSINYQKTMVSLGDGSFAAMKYNIHYGEAWKLNAGKWEKIEDLELIPKSIYSIEIVSTNDGYWGAIRLDSNNGRSWQSVSGRWIEIIE